MTSVENDSLDILMVAYACDPEGSGEHWLGWEWAVQASKRYRVHLVTTPHAREAILRRAPEYGIKPYFVSVGKRVRRMTFAIGDGGGWLRKHAWQRRVLHLARDLHRKIPFVLVHQTTFHTFRVPFLASKLPIPSVWGPIAGGESVPPGFLSFLGSAALSERTRAWVNKACLRLPSVRQALRRTSAIWVSNRVTLDFLPPEYRGKAVVVPPNALRAEDAVPPSVWSGEHPLTLLYVGNCVFTRALPLVFAALREARLEGEWRLQIVGQGPALPFWKAEAVRFGIADRVEFAGSVPRATLAGYYSKAHAFVFPALRDSGGSALLEAMSKGVLVICLDWGGPGEMVDAKSGIKIGVANAAETISKMAEAFRQLAADPDWSREIAQNAGRRAREQFSWQAKGRILEKTYAELLAR